jgi:hypothetical protein
LFDYLKSQLEGKAFFDKTDVKEEVRGILGEIRGNLFHSFMDEWVRELEQCIELAGESVS